ncbi:MAG TPA: hypothetical protein VFE40_09070 [Jatrophihabitantaceae bacterium]|nr:hypothetical protein [Jatrophihabitantaceae bacterium]
MTRPATAPRPLYSRSIDRLVGSAGVEPRGVKVPLQITALFWITKLVSTAMGESLADWLDGSANIVLAGLGGLVALLAFVVALRLQFRAVRYVTAVYWFAVAMVATFGTMAADALHQFLAAPYWLTTAFYAAVLALVFWRWWANERTLSIHNIDTRRREKFYWGAVMATFALGTAAGDWTGDSLQLHYLPSGILFACIIAVPAVAYYLGMNAVVTFWFAYVLTRPLGASFADYMDYPKARAGLGLPHVLVWGSLAAAMIILTALLAVSERRSRDRSAGSSYAYA